MSGLMAIGGAVLRVIGLNPQRVQTRSESRVPAKPTFTGMDHQLTGMGERRTRIEFATVPLLVGGMDTLAILEAIHAAQAVVPYIRLGSNWLGSLDSFVVLQSLDVGEERLHPFTGIGRIVHGEAELVHVGDTASEISSGLPNFGG